MRRFIILLVYVLCGAMLLPAQVQEVKLKLIETSDIHGNFYPFNFITQKEWGGSLARVCTYVEQQRATYEDRLILLDNGDILQGQPSVYYYNYMDTVSPHLCAEMMNYMKYDIGNMGNHDVETGHLVFDRWISECEFPVLGANIIETSSGQPYLKPYQVLQRDGIKIVVLGMITPAIPMWLSENLWKGLRFDDMEETARKWMKIIREKEKPDLVVGLLHAGKSPVLLGGLYRENASVTVAKNVPGFDIVMMGHDHLSECSKIANVAGDSVLVVNPANNGRLVVDIDVVFALADGKVKTKQVSGRLASMKDVPVSEEFLDHFTPQFDTVQAFVSKKIGTFTEDLTTRPAYFGSSAFIDFIHSLQLDISGAEISFAAPLSFDAMINKGDVTVGDMFSLYQYENMLYVMTLTGREIKGALEESYYQWTYRMKSPQDPLLWLKKSKKEGEAGRVLFENYSFNFDSASGIIYTVDVTRPKGQKVEIICLANGQPFDLKRTYKVALNSYRGNGGGELLTKGAGIPQNKLKDRIVYSTDKDLRFYLINYIQKKGQLSPRALNQWSFLPEEWTVPAIKRDYKLLFGEEWPKNF